jgi:hypothetical protein
MLRLTLLLRCDHDQRWTLERRIGPRSTGSVTTAFDATRRLLARQSRGTMRPRQNSRTRYMT